VKLLLVEFHNSIVLAKSGCELSRSEPRLWCAATSHLRSNSACSRRVVAQQWCHFLQTEVTITINIEHGKHLLLDNTWLFL
jgi:hypothetical protein